MAMPNVFYHYTSHECLESILDSGVILPSRPHPATPGWVGGVNLNATADGVVFLTRMDPKTSKNSIAFNNFRCCHDLDVWFSCDIIFHFSGGWSNYNSLRKVEAYIAVEMNPSPLFAEESVKDNLSYRSIVGHRQDEAEALN